MVGGAEGGMVGAEEFNMYIHIFSMLTEIHNGASSSHSVSVHQIRDTNMYQSLVRLYTS